MEHLPPASQSLRPEVPPKRPPKEKGLEGIAQWLREKKLYGPEYDYYKGKEMFHSVTLEPITQTSQAVFQVPSFFL